MYDVIVIGARCAGAPTAMLLAQKGYRVLLVDRAHFPSDTLSTHNIQVPGGAALRRWGLLEAVQRTNCPPVHQAAFHIGSLAIRGHFPPLGGVDAVHSPRRTRLDPILIDAAVAAGAELREDFIVEELLFDGQQVVGVRGRTKSTRDQPVEERARLVIGADGKHSLVARLAKAGEYRVKPTSSCAYYTYWSGLDLNGGEAYNLSDRTFGIWATNDGLAMIYMAYPIRQFQAIRADIEGTFWQSAAQVPGLVERLRAGAQAERFYGTADLPVFYRVPYGPGWALIGDAGMALDPITGQGITHAFRDAERLSEALDEFFCGWQSYSAAMSEYQRQRDEETSAIYDFTAQLSSFAPPGIEQQVLFSALAHNPQAADQFLGVITGSVPMKDFFNPANLLKIMGIGGISRVLWHKLHHSIPGANPQTGLG